MKSKSSSQPSTASAGTTRAPAWLLAAALVPLALGGYLLTLSLTGGSAAGCGIDSGCGSVLGSAWSRWLGIPVAALALPLYALQFSLLAFPDAMRRLDPSGRWLPVRALSLMLGGLVGGALWFAFVQMRLIHAFCPWCLATHLSGIAVCVLALLHAPGAGSRIGIGPWMSLSGVLSVATLALGQGISIGTPSSAGSTAVAVRPAATPASQPAEKPTPTPQAFIRNWTLPISGVTLPVHEVPVLGNPAAPQLVLHFFDYTCKHCRAMHPMLMEALDQSSNLVAVVSLPIPLEMDCNPLLKRPIADHIGACGLARVGLALWKAAPGRLREFDDWVFSQPSVPAYSAAEAKALELAGEAAFRRAQASPEIDSWIRTALGIYETQYRLTRVQNLPELLVGTNLYSGAVRDPAVLKARLLGTTVAPSAPR